MIQLSYELAMMRRDELLRQASARRLATQAAASAPARRVRLARTPHTLRRLPRLRLANLRVSGGEGSRHQVSSARVGRRLDRRR
jgi:hypothetical protein